MSRLPFDRVVLVGFMGAGKTAVGASLAEALGWRWLDVDARIEEAESCSLETLFERSGEAHFRVLEARATLNLLVEREVVISTGGGWAAVPGRLDELPPRTASVWLRVSAAEALRRVQASGAARPLLAVADPHAAARRLLEDREAHYARADWTVDTEGRTVDDVSAQVLALLRIDPNLDD